MKTVLMRIGLFIVLLVLCLTACSDDENSIQLVGFSKPGFVAEADGYTFVTDYHNVYKIDNTTYEMSQIFTSDVLLSGILENSGCVFIEDIDDVVFITDYNGDFLDVLTDSNIIYVADGYVYYENDTEIRRVQGLSYDTELIAGKNEWGDHVVWTDYIGYYDEKIFYQKDNELIYILTEDGEKQYYCDGEYITLNENKLIILKENTLYSKDLVTGKEQQIGEAPSSDYLGIYAKYIGNYGDKDYYIIAGEIFVDGIELTVKHGAPFESVSNAVVANEWVYLDSGTLCRYNILTQEKEFISYLGKPNAVFQCHNRLYYIDDDKETCVYSIDLDDYSCRLVYDGSIDMMY